MVRTSWDKTLLPRKNVSTYVRHPPHSVPIVYLGSVQRYAALQSRPPEQGVKRASPLGMLFSTVVSPAGIERATTRSSVRFRLPSPFHLISISSAHSGPLIRSFLLPQKLMLQEFAPARVVPVFRD
jgi:hypothetical protein